MKKGIIKVIVISIIIVSICYLGLTKVFKIQTMAASAGSKCPSCEIMTLSYQTKNCKYGLWCNKCNCFFGTTTPKHSYGSWITYQSATCTSAAKTKRTCSSCGNVEYGTGQSATGHTKSTTWTTTKTVTCTENGKEAKKCVNCGKIMEERELIAVGHIPEGWWETTKQPTCTEPGEKTSGCQRCTGKLVQEIPAKGHNKSDTWTTSIKVTCTENGLEVKKCLNCGLAMENREIKAVGHIPEGWWETTKQPTCTEPGEKTNGCQRCTGKLVQEISALGGHDLGDWEVSVEGTCQTKARLIRHCRRTDICDYTETKEGEYGDHSFGDWQIYIYGDCNTKRVMRRYCKTCSGNEEQEGNLIHPYVKEEIIKEPTCVEDGEKKITCYSCGAEEKEVITSVGSHNMQLTPDKNKPGEHYKACIVCGQRDSEEGNVDCDCKLIGYTPTPKYCTDIGTMEYKCECGYTYKKQEQFQPRHSTEHDGGIHLIKEATCVETGYRTFYCGNDLPGGIRCSYEYDGQELPIDPNAHNMVWTTVKGIAAMDQYICTLCGYIQIMQDCIPKEEKTKYYPTCISDGYERYHCKICDRPMGEPDFSTNMGKALGHDYQDGITCARCSHRIEEVESIKYEIKDTYISNINSQTTMGDFMGQIISDASEINVYKSDNTIVNENEKIATGMKIESKSGDRTSTLTIVVKGDANGDGNADFSDIVALNKARLGRTVLENEFFKAGDVNNDEKNDFFDLVRLNKFRLNKLEEL